MAVARGFSLSKKAYSRRYDVVAQQVYERAQITDSVKEVVGLLQRKQFCIGLVNSLRMQWIEQTLNRIPFRDEFEYVASVNDREDLQAKPHPDGYLDAMEYFGAIPDRIIILEDSNTGIQAAKASGAVTICLRYHLEEGYVSEGADIW